MRCTLNISVGAVTLNIFAPRLSLLFFLLFSFPCSLCFYFSSFLFSLLPTSGYFINSAHSRCYYSFFLHYTHYFILFSTLCNQLSVLLQGHPRGLHKHTHAHYEAGLRCRFSIPVFTWEQTTSLHGLLPFCCPPPCWHKELMEYK